MKFDASLVYLQRDGKGYRCPCCEMSFTEAGGKTRNYYKALQRIKEKKQG